MRIFQCQAKITVVQFFTYSSGEKECRKPLDLQYCKLRPTSGIGVLGYTVEQSRHKVKFAQQCRHNSAALFSYKYTSLVLKRNAMSKCPVNVIALSKASFKDFLDVVFVILSIVELMTY